MVDSAYSFHLTTLNLHFDFYNLSFFSGKFLTTFMAEVKRSRSHGGLEVIYLHNLYLYVST